MGGFAEIGRRKNNRIAMKKHCLYFESGLQTREMGAERTPSVEGVAIVTEQETLLYEDYERREYEVIDASCISEEFINGQDIKLNLLHERDLSFARWNKGKGSLHLATMEDGLHFEAELPDCDLGRRCQRLVENGTYTGCSFEFWPKDYTVTERVGSDGKAEYLVRHTAFERLGAITIGMDPAYEGTSVSVRELIEAKRRESAEAKDAAAVEAAEVEAKAEAEAAKAKAEKDAAEKAERERKLRLMEYAAEA